MDFATARHNMVESQIRTNKVRNLSLLDALDEVPREKFLPPERRAIAYNDEDLPLGEGRFLMEPMVLSRLIQAAEVAEGDLVLDV
ncbi:MAG: protein-L-isoaspartate O-methyltransferase, partial [Desulfuromonadales bacterium]|nr:protein-L-isoaspartate O-methyltransferase [Desulfuromonadales bacterium]NIS42290.1 protein-L-isoaspartate O-methyltransferase [Desulfuromonadales bacterium]